ncbi:MAG: alpha/beta fold hydrolase [Gemmatimonadetes bacterium]|nr:alpha/beta fold hydrolase [Gemmatimonadota bacterium]
MVAAAVDTGSGTRRIAVTPGDSVSVEVSGAGAPIVLLAGPVGGTYSYRHVVPELVAAGYQVVAIDPFDPANGGHTPPTLGTLAHRWGAALTALGLRQAVIVSHSVSNAIALRLALEHPEMVRGIVSMEGGAAEHVGQHGTRTAAAIAHLVKLPGGGRLVRHKIRGALRERSAQHAWITEEVVRAYAAPYLRDPSRVASLMRSLGDTRDDTPLGPRLAALRIPILLLMGDTPHPSRPGDDERAMIVAAIPHLQVETLAAAGHFLHEEQPARVVQWVLRRARSAQVLANSPPE